MNKICFGCGVKLQSENPSNIGYIPEAKYKDSSYCQRCYKIIHYGKNETNEAPKEIKNIIRAINTDNKFVVFLTDFLSINSKIMDIFHNIKNNKMLIISKRDIIPRSVKEITIINYLRNNYNINTDIKFISSNNNYGVDAFYNYLYKRNIDAAYIIGESNSGKSTFINKLISKTNSKINKITTSNVPNTTMDFIRIKLNEDLTIIDSPGFVIPSIDNDIITNKNNIKNNINPRTFQMKENEMLSIENIYLMFSENTPITLYLSNDIVVNKYFKEVEFDNEIKISKNSDLIINGLGFINIKKKCNIKTFNLNSDILELRESIFSDDRE